MAALTAEELKEYKRNYYQNNKERIAERKAALWRHSRHGTALPPKWEDWLVFTGEPGCLRWKIVHTSSHAHAITRSGYARVSGAFTIPSQEEYAQALAEETVAA